MAHTTYIANNPGRHTFDAFVEGKGFRANSSLAECLRFILYLFLALTLTGYIVWANIELESEA